MPAPNQVESVNSYAELAIFSIDQCVDVQVNCGLFITFDHAMSFGVYCFFAL